MSQTVCVLGATGMLGAMVLDVLSQEPGLSLTATVRTVSQGQRLASRYPDVNWIIYDAEVPAEKTEYVAQHDWVINNIGITKPLIHENVPAEVERAIRVNALWPHTLGRAISERSHRLLQIATDCVFSGQNGPYAEPSTPDAHDVYGRTKALGEVTHPGCTNLRTSIIGPEIGPSKFLLEWVKRQPHNAVLSGYVDHHWNGVTTLHFAKICLGIIRTRPAGGALVHVVPRDIVNKLELLRIIAKAHGRTDILVHAQATRHANMTLATHQPAVVRALWAAAGYSEAPTVEQMVQEVARYQFQP